MTYTLREPPLNYIPNNNPNPIYTLYFMRVRSDGYKEFRFDGWQLGQS